MSRILQLFVFLLLLGRTAVQQEGRLCVAPHAPGAGSLGADAAGELAGTSEPLRQALLAGAPAFRTVSQSDSAVLQLHIAAPQTTAARSAAVDESCLPVRGVPGTILGRAPPPILY